MTARAPYRKSPEDILHEDILEYLRWVLPPEYVVWHPANEGKRTGWEQGRFVARGGMAGVFDLQILMPLGRVAFLEIKTDKKDLSEAQQDFRDRLIRLGVPYAVVRSIENVRAALAQWAIPTREAA